MQYSAFYACRQEGFKGMAPTIFPAASFHDVDTFTTANGHLTSNPATVSLTLK